MKPRAAPVPPAGSDGWVERGSGDYRRIVIALFLSGYATFSLLYCVQPLLPLFSHHFHLDAAHSALALSATTLLVAPALLLAGAVSERTHRKPLIAASIGSAALLNLLAATVPNWTALLILRALEGLALGGVPAVSMTYLAEEIAPRSLGAAMGLYIGGNAIGGMAGRLLTGLAAQFAGWRGALAVIGLLGLASAAAFVLLLPPSRHFVPRSAIEPRRHLGLWLQHLRDPQLKALFLVGGLLAASFVTFYNAISYRLLGPPYDLNQAEIGLIFVTYLLGTLASTLAGSLADRIGRRVAIAGGVGLSVLGLLLTLATGLVAAIGGLAFFTMGFFAAHTVASSSVGRIATDARAHAASLYLLSFYLCSSLLSVLGGTLWEHAGWTAVIEFCVAMLLAALALAWRATAPRQVPRAGLLILALTAALAPARALAQPIPSPFLQDMVRAEIPDPLPAPPDMAPLRRLRIAGLPIRLGHTRLAGVAHRLGVEVEHQRDSDQAVDWLCVRLDVPPGVKPPPGGDVLSLWLVSDSQGAGGEAAMDALALDTVRADGRHCPSPRHDAGLVLDPRLALPGSGVARVAQELGQAPPRTGRAAYQIVGPQPEGEPLTLTLSTRFGRVEALWLAAAPDN